MVIGIAEWGDPDVEACVMELIGSFESIARFNFPELDGILR